MTQDVRNEIEEQISQVTALHKRELADAASSAAKAIADAAVSAAKAMAEAASSASTLVAHNAEESARSLAVQRSSDHDAIVRISEKIDSLKADVRDLKDGITKRVENLECEKLNIRDSYSQLYKKAHDDFQIEMYNRIKTVEEGYAQIKMLGIVAVLFLGLLQFIIDKFILK